MFVFKHPYSRFVAVITCFAYRFAKYQEKARTHTFHLKRNSVSAAAVSQHACYYAPFRVPLPMFTTSLNYVALFPMKPDIVTVHSGMFFTR